jgi:hypothetical protein
MKTRHEIEEETSLLTLEMETKYPALYKTLEETPIFQLSPALKGIPLADLENYLETLKRMVKEHLASHTRDL